MRRITLLFGAAILAAVITGCTSGPTTTETRDVNGVDEVSMSGIGRLEIEQGSTESLEVQGPRDVVADLDTRMDGSVLRIEYNPSFWALEWLRPDQDVTIYLTVQELERIELSGAGSVRMEDFEGSELEIDVSGAGDVKVADLSVEQLDCQLSGAGSFEVDGEAEEQAVRLSGAGSYEAEELESSSAEIEVSGAGNATVWVKRELDLTLSGAGNISYYGNPRVQQDVSGAGRVQSLGDK